MSQRRRLQFFLVATFLAFSTADRHAIAATADEAVSKEEAACSALSQIRNLTIISAELMDSSGPTPQYCHVRGLISPVIHYHVQLPLPANWNGRFLKWGDGGKDGDLDFADHRVAQGYAVANSNTGHDAGTEPGASFGFNNRQSEIDFGYRAVHLTTNAAKTLLRAYYGKDPAYSYFEGCSTGGRQGMMESQRFPYDFDGIVAGDPVNVYQAMNATQIWLAQKMYKNNFAGNLAFDTNADGIPDSLTKLNMLMDAVLAKCDARDGIQDGVIDDPLSCDFNPDTDLAGKMCAGDVNADHCFTKAQIQTIKASYSGAYDSKGARIYKGNALGSEFGWPVHLIPHKGNNLRSARMGTAGDHINYLFYENDPGVTLPDITDLSLVPDKKSNPPEYVWWDFNVDDFTAGKAKLMMSIMDATDPDLTRFLTKKKGKLILYHGWGDTATHPEPTLDYFKEMVTSTFKGDLNTARGSARLFMAPGMDHCRGGPGPNDWDKLAPLVEWVENGKAPDFVVATHARDGKVDNERKLCAYPQRAVYTGPAGGQDNPANWIQGNFTCK